MTEVQQEIRTVGRPQLKASTRLRLPIAYACLIAVGTFDILFTTIILSLGGAEANPIAAAVIEQYGLAGLVAFKYLVIAVVILGCEFVASARIETARRLALVVVAITAAPVVWSTGLLIKLVA
ncbi:MAG: DUF5658 family protein [Pseudomonadota bacterium]